VCFHQTVANYFHFVARELRQIMSELGIKNVDDMIGRTDLLAVDTDSLPWKAPGIDFSKILYKPSVPAAVNTRCTIAQDHGINDVLDVKLIALAKNALEKQKPVNITLGIKNINRATGAMLSGKVCKLYGEEALPEDTIRCKFKGVAGQSFGAFLARGITFELEGMANDYVGKGISGGKIIVYPDKRADYKSQENIIIGNTCFYGAINGQAYIRGIAGERFCIRNSGIYTVVEGVGDHGCEYMTGGRVVILGNTGRNFAAGMSGGIAYVYNLGGDFKHKVNMEMVALDKIDKDDEITIYELLHNHFQYTQSNVGEHVLGNFKKELLNFVKVIPLEYKRILDAKKLEEKLDLAQDLEG
jgi:glutamate synthase domain-containing protein 3